MNEAFRYLIARLVIWLVRVFLTERASLAEPQSLVASTARPRSSRWPAFRRAWLDVHPGCAVTGETEDVDVHHIVPFHVDPSRECDPTNVMTLSRRSKQLGGMNLHLWIGHNGNFQDVNPKARELAAALREGLKHANQ